MIFCAPPDGDVGAAIRIAAYVDCQARALGENGFQAFAGGPAMTSALSGLVTILIALVGYRLILGRAPNLSDGFVLTFRLGAVLALMTSWPAFQTIVYRVVIDSPGELASIILPSTGLPSTGLDARVQAAYDTMRLGWSEADPTEGALTPASEPGSVQTGPDAIGSAGVNRPMSIGQPPLPQTASIFVMTTVGLSSAFKLAVGFLLATAPIAILSLLFDATLGIFAGWVRALAGGALATLSSAIVTAVALVVLESELASAQAYGRGGVIAALDTQALTTITLSFALAGLVAAGLALRMAAAFRMPIQRSLGAQDVPAVARSASTWALPEAKPGALSPARAAQIAEQSRITAINDALSTTVRREQAALVGAVAGSRQTSLSTAVSQPELNVGPAPLGVAGRRATPRSTLSAKRRDRSL